MVTEVSVMAVICASRPSFRNPSDKVAFAIHASFMADGYYLVAAGIDAFADNLPTDGDEVGIEGWNELEDSYGFVYSKSENGLKKQVLVKCLAIGDALMVDVLNLKEENKEPLHLQINVKGHTTDGTSNYKEMFKNLRGMLANVNAGIFKQLNPVVPRASVFSGRDRSERSTTTVPAKSYAGRPYGGGFFYPPLIPAPRNSDIFPGASAGISPDRAPGIGGGMPVGPNDPRWFGRGEAPRLGGVLRAPPGVRFDPYGPLPGLNDPRWFGCGETPRLGGVPRAPPGVRFDPYGPLPGPTDPIWFGRGETPRLGGVPSRV